MKASHTFNLLDARGAISVTERAAYIGRVRSLRARSRRPTTIPAKSSAFRCSPPHALKASSSSCSPKSCRRRHCRRSASAFANGIRGELVALGLAPKTGKFEKRPCHAPPPRGAGERGGRTLPPASEAREVHPGPQAASPPPPAAVAGFAKKHGVAVEALQRKAGGGRAKCSSPRVKAGGAALDEVLAGVVDRRGAQAADSQGHALGRRRCGSCARCTAWSCCTGPAWCRAWSSDSTPATERGDTALWANARSPSFRRRITQPRCARRRPRGCRFDERRSAIERGALGKSNAPECRASGSYHYLLDEVTALVEHPSVYVGTFAPSSLDVPPECLILTMRQNQKYFPLFDARGSPAAAVPRSCAT